MKLTPLSIDLSVGTDNSAGCIGRAEKRSRFYMVRHQCFHFWETKGTVIGNHWIENLACINFKSFFRGELFLTAKSLLGCISMF